MNKLKSVIIAVLTLFISGTARADADQSQVLWYNIATGELSSWLLTINNPGQVTGTQKLSWSCDPTCARDWKVVGTGNFKDTSRFKMDVLWHNQNTGEVSAWRTDFNGKVTGTLKLSWSCDAASGCSRDWKVVGTGDFNGDGATDVLWHNQSTGEVSAWLLDPSGTGIVRG